MKIVAYTPLHYGRDYLASAIQSVIDSVDLYYVLYSQYGSHGHRSDIACPESEYELRSIAETVAGKKLRWVRGLWQWEGQQRDTIFDIARDADAIVALDADEIWNDVDGAIISADLMDVRNVRVPMVHFWRSFHRAITEDPAYPTRIIFPGRQGEGTLAHRAIAHMGYAQREEIVEYKLRVHGHKNEFRTDCDWFRDVFAANRQTDCHPVGSQYWNPMPVNWRQYMPSWMAIHPYATKAVIR